MIEFRRRAVSAYLYVLLLSVVLLRPVHADSLAHDPFESYDAGAALNAANGGDGWTGPWFAEPPVTVETKSIRFANLDGSSKAAQLIGTDFLTIMNRPFPTISDTVYMGMLVRTENWDDDFMQLQVSNGATGNGAETMTIGIDGRDAAGFFARTGTSGDGSSFSTGTVHETDTDYYLVGKFSKEGGDTYNRVDLFVNPIGTAEPATPDATRVGIDTGLSELSLFTVRHALMEGTEQVYLDELRLATTFAEVSVVPEPNAVVMFLLGSLLILRIRSRRAA